MSLEFGTAGIRGIVGNDENNLNEAHAAQVFEAFAKYINKKFSKSKTKTIVIGRDNRIKGKEFANLAVKIMSQNGIKVYFNNKMLPTPFISFLIKHKKAIGGINITASHNPKEYNGIKLYNHLGYQMLPNEIENVKKQFKKYDQYISLIDKKIILDKNDKKNILEIKQKDINSYVKSVCTLNNKKIDLSNIKIVYSSLHGTGYQFLKNIFKKLKANVIYEPNEIKEDKNFSFVSNPNPESKEAFKNTIKLAKEQKADLILITDPDSDRVGVAYKSNNEFNLINGNENAILITDYLLNNRRIKNNSYLVYSFVSTSLPAKMCKEKNIKSYITETGFKWIGQKINNLKNKENFFYGFEESYGSLINEKIALDKDAIQGVVAILIIASMAKNQNMNLNYKLNQIYQQYGYMKAKSFSFDLKDKKQLESIKSKFKKLKFKNAIFYDYSKGIRDIEPNDMLSYEFKNSSNWISLRPSGTEPKFKIYIHVLEKTEKESVKLFNSLFKTIKEKLEL